MVVDGSNPRHQWLGEMEGWVSLAARGDWEICWYNLSTGNRTRVARMVAQRITHYATAALYLTQVYYDEPNHPILKSFKIITALGESRQTMVGIWKICALEPILPYCH